MTGQTRELGARSVERPLLGQVAIVTGAAKGLGASICELFAQQGAHLALVGRDAAALHAHAAALDAANGDRESLVAPCSVVDEQAVSGMVDDTLERFGRIDILVNSAGGTGPIETPAQEVSLDEFRQVLELNVLGTFLPCKVIIPHMIRQASGRIVNIAGTSGLRGYRNRVGYSSSKWAVRGMTRTLALELGPYGVTVNTVCPNVTNGDRMERIVREKARKLGVTQEEVYADFAGQTPLGRFIDEIDIASAVSFLVSEGARNITGQDLVVDAGWSV
ncbi:MAG TPA: SDR family NAD(P)-dependent oxidoreductase [Candidatus Binatia bacterium]|nr:SDR family NAD(P)-dependent oxidoreductase [Candidatus Binatia bacterium]